jgi:hypothetical protein
MRLECSRLKNSAPLLRRPAGRRPLCHPGAVLSSMRDSRGGPSFGMKVLAVVVALLLAGPLTVLIVRAAAAAIRLAV